MIKSLAYPVRLGAVVLHRAAHLPWKHKYTRFGLAVTITCTGAYMATSIHQEVVPHFLWDALSYTIHGIGAAPIVERAAIYFVTE